MKRIIYSGNQLGWLTATANMLMDRGADQAPLAVGDLVRRVPDQVGTARNDGHVTAAENGLDRNDYKAGYRIWIDGALDALRHARLIDDELRWTGNPAKTHKVKFAGKTYSVPDKEPRKQSRDRYMLGDPDKDWMSPSLGSEGRVLRGDIPPLTVKVRTHWRGKDRIHDERLEIHPIALAIPPMTPAEQQIVRADIEKNGVKVPLVIYPDANDLTAKGKPKRKILDGRHRGYFASVTGQPVELEEFDGTEEQARDHVASLNLHRRQLTRQQRALAAQRLYGEQAAKEAAKDRERAAARGGKAPTNLSEPSNGRKRGQEAHERVRDLAGGEAAGFSKADAKAAALVAQAPDVAAKVEAGELTNTSEAARQAKAEINGTQPDRTVGANVTDTMSTIERLGKAIYALKMAEQEWTIPDTAEIAAEADARFAEIIQRAERLRRLVSEHAT